MGVEPLPIKAGSPTVPMPGYDVRILRRDGSRLRTRRGRCDLPSRCRCRRAPCRRCGATTPVTRRRICASIPGYYLTGDGGYLDEDGYLFVMGRIDDVINVAGHRLSTGAIEDVLAAHPAVAECAVIGVADEIKGQVPRGLVVLKAGASPTVWPTSSWRRCATRSVPWRASSWSMSLPRCRRRARARFCEKRCAGSPTARTNPCRRLSRTPPCSTHCGRFFRGELHVNGVVKIVHDGQRNAPHRRIRMERGQIDGRIVIDYRSRGGTAPVIVATTPPSRPPTTPDGLWCWMWAPSICSPPHQKSTSVQPDTTLSAELSGGMMAYDWTINGRPFADTVPLTTKQGQRATLTFNIMSMMWHPMHLHGHTFQIIKPDGTRGARKDTVIVLPRQRLTVDVVADNPGEWMLYCHNTYHQEAGMMTSLNYVA